MTDDSLITGEQLLTEVFGGNGRPTERWLRKQVSEKGLPAYKIGRLVRYSAAEVRGWIEKNCARDRAKPKKTRA